MFKFIINPEDSKNYSIFSTKGKELIKNYIKLIKGGMNKTNNTFKFKRDELETKYKPSRVPRKKSGKEYVTELLESTNYKNIGRYLSKSEVNDEKNRLKDLFPNSIKLIDEYKGIDQGSEGACTLVGFLNLLKINGKTKIVKSKKPNVIRSWKKIWNSFNIEVSADIATTLDIMVKKKLFIGNPFELINYIPIRSEGRRELCFNEEYWVDEDILIEKYNINKKIYNETPWIYQIANKIESLLDENIPVLINAMEHTRTCIGYNDNKLLFADNWGMNYQQTSDNPYNDQFKAGFSTINKWAIYTWVRELVHLM